MEVGRPQICTGLGTVRDRPEQASRPPPPGSGTQQCSSNAGPELLLPRQRGVSSLGGRLHPQALSLLGRGRLLLLLSSQGTSKRLQGGMLRSRASLSPCLGPGRILPIQGLASQLSTAIPYSQSS